MNSHQTIEPIVLPMPALLGTVNAHLIRGPEGIALVDCGLNDASSLKDLRIALEKRGLTFEDIDTVFLTHHHVDHAGAARFLQERGAQILMSSKDAALATDFYHRPELDEPRVMFSGRHGLPQEFTKSIQSIFSFLRHQGTFVKPDAIVSGGDTISLGGVPFETIATPGHTSGHLCLIQRDLGIAFTGDCVISPRATHVSASTEDPPTDAFQEFIDSLELLSTLTGVTPLSGHGAHIKALDVSAPRIIAHLENELTSLESRLSDEPKSAFSLSRTVQKMRPRVFPQWLAVSQTVTYLLHLTLVGRAQCEETEAGFLYRRK